MELKNSITTRRDGLLTYIKVDNVTDFDISKTFDCGQCFRFEPVTDSRHECEFYGVAHGRLISLAQDGNNLYIYNTTEEEYFSIWRRYLGLDTDYAEILHDILSRSDNPALTSAVAVGRGIRILRQEPWEAVCSFIISQNNNIPRIKKIISHLSSRLGNRVAAPGMERHGGCDENRAFPDATAVHAAGADLLFELRTGFRAKYIADAAEKFCCGGVDIGFLEACSDTTACAEHLKAVKGIGDKVAACALLFGFGKLDAFPVDVWIKRVIARYFGEGFDKTSLGPYAGVAQQYLFYYERWLGGKKNGLDDTEHFDKVTLK